MHNPQTPSSGAAVVGSPSEAVRSMLDQATEADLDRLPFGLIQLSRTGVVLQYNRVEAEFAGMSRRDVVGRNFFVEVAPCTRVQEFYGAFLEGVSSGSLDVVFPYEFRFRDGRRKDAVISMFFSAFSDSVWVVVERPTPA